MTIFFQGAAPQGGKKQPYNKTGTAAKKKNRFLKNRSLFRRPGFPSLCFLFLKKRGGLFCRPPSLHTAVKSKKKRRTQQMIFFVLSNALNSKKRLTVCGGTDSASATKKGRPKSARGGGACVCFGRVRAGRFAEGQRPAPLSNTRSSLTVALGPRRRPLGRRRRPRVVRGPPRRAQLWRGWGRKKGGGGE